MISTFLEFFNAVDNFNIHCKHRQIMKTSSNEPTCFNINWPYLNKCIRDDTKAATRQSLNCIETKKYGDKQYARWNSYTLQCGTITTLISCNVACGSRIVTVNSPSGSTQCDTWLWDDMPLNSPKRPPYFTSGFHFHTSCRHVILYQSAKFYPNRTTLGRKK